MRMVWNGSKVYTKSGMTKKDLCFQERAFDDQEAVQAWPAHEERRLDESCRQGPQRARDHGIRHLEPWSPGPSAVQARQVVHVDALCLTLYLLRFAVDCQELPL